MIDFSVVRIQFHGESGIIHLTLDSQALGKFIHRLLEQQLVICRSLVELLYIQLMAENIVLLSISIFFGGL